MTVESATYLSQLDSTLPTGGDVKSEGDNHLRLIKAVLKATFPNVSGAVTATHTELNSAGGAASGSWSPASSSPSNCTVDTIGTGQYIKVGSVYTVSIVVSITVAGAGLFVFDLAPVTGTVSAGRAAGSAGIMSGGLSSSPSPVVYANGGKLRIDGYASGAGARDLYIQATYTAA